MEQNPSLNTDKTALKNVLIGQAGQTSWLRRLTGMVRSDDYMGAMDELEKFGLLDKAHLKAGVLSGGERQRVAICRALVHGANFMSADEPVVGLDPQTAEKVILTLKRLCEEQNKTIVTALPIELAERYCHRLLGIADGNLVFDVTGRRLTAQEKRSIHLL
ncbi:Phosphate-import ATP-binding protein PhnC [compost metagenome]